MHILCADLEGVFVPEIWINVAEKTGISALRKTTRDEPDYDKLMRYRLDILSESGLRLPDIQKVIAAMSPLPGAVDFINWLRPRMQLIVVSDTFVQFAGPLMESLGYPTIFCNELTVAEDGVITGYRLRQADGKRKAAEGLKALNLRVIAVGDSYNDITMLQAADHGILFRPPDNVTAEFPRLPVTREYAELQDAILRTIG